MKAVKIIGGLVVAAIAVVAIVVVVGLQNLDQIVKTAVERVGPQVVGTEVGLADVKLDLQKGRGELHGLTVANPQGFSNNSAFSLGEIALDIDPASLTGDVIVINEVLISKAQLLAEHKGLAETNLQALLDNVKKNSGSSGSTESQTSEAGADVKLAIEKFTFEEGAMKLQSEEWGEQSLKLPTIRLKDIGSKEQGLTPDELASAVIQPILASAKEAVQDHLEDLAKEKAKEKLNEKLKEKLGEDGAEKLDQLKSLFSK
ncbi:AsmA family protein [Pseudomaricurvus alkylphenolicus]|jgi:hypothetical protein|uniref:AsmA family protein n=1 Tax=Pseudomaricurvus alkylphenolicus TaxID=1306991 RepID=UPI00142290F1|nr:AsmA family protein [Pseudomaricurvus alkylphenolicus]NIB43736.1 AsmA family protein [Pseudomaricurvus alkylphenolicus]